MAFTGSELGDATSERLVRLNSEAYERQQQRLQQGQSSPIEEWYGAELARRAQQKLQEAPPEQAAYRADVTQSNAWQDALNAANAQLVYQQRTSLLDHHATGGSLLIGPPMIGATGNETTATLGGDAPAGMPSLLKPGNGADFPTGDLPLSLQPKPVILGGDAPTGMPKRLQKSPGQLHERRGLGATEGPNNAPGVLGSDAAMGDEPMMFNPQVKSYIAGLKEFYDHRKLPGTTAGGTGADGSFYQDAQAALGGSTAGPGGFPSMTSIAFPGFLVKNPKSGKWTYEKAGSVLQATSANAMKDPKLAGELMFAMSSTGAYPHAAEEAVIDRLYRDPNSGDILGHWTETDLTALHTALLQTSLIQADEVPQGVFRDPLEIMRDRAHQGEQLVKNNIPQGPPKAAGRGGGGRGGGGGGGSAPGIQVDPDQLKLLVNNVAKQELGRQLTDEEAQRFVSAFQANAGDMAKVNPQGRATAFMQGDKKLVNEAAGQSSGQFVMALARFLASPAPGALPKGTQANG